MAAAADFARSSSVKRHRAARRLADADADRAAFHHFMLGGNRDNSTDSGVMSVLGLVPYENLVGPFAVKYVQGSGEE